jgi:hypothetical protein
MLKLDPHHHFLGKPSLFELITLTFLPFPSMTPNQLARQTLEDQHRSLTKQITEVNLLDYLIEEHPILTLT